MRTKPEAPTMERKFVPLHPLSPDFPRVVSSGQLSLARPVGVRCVLVDVLCRDVHGFGLFILVETSAPPDRVFVPITPTVLVQALVDVARVLPAVPPPALAVKSGNPVIVVAPPAVPDTVPPDALENVPELVVPPLPTTT